MRSWEYDGVALASIQKINFNAYTLRHGVNVAGGDLDDDGFEEITTAAGPGPSNTTWFKGFDFDGGSLTLIPGFQVTPYTTHYGGRVGTGDVDTSPPASPACVLPSRNEVPRVLARSRVSAGGVR